MRLLCRETSKFKTRCTNVITQWKVQFAGRKTNLLLIDNQEYELGGKVSTLKATGKPTTKGSIYPFLSMIDLLVEVLGDSPNKSPLDEEHWEMLNEIIYNEIPPISGQLMHTKDRQKTKRILK